VVEALAQGSVGVRVSLALALVTLVMVALAETGRVPIDNPATHLELTMVHEAMVLEYGGRHLALIELAGMLRLLLFVSLIGAVFVPWTLLPRDGAPAMALLGLVAYGAKLLVAAVLLGLFETSIAKMRVFRVAEFLGVAFLVGVMAAIFLFVSRGIGP
jgi:formate hydrogenlyase subunit 4